MVQEPYVEPPPERIGKEEKVCRDSLVIRCFLDIVHGTNYLLESLGIDRRIRSVNEFASPVLIPMYENICSNRLNGLYQSQSFARDVHFDFLDVRTPVRNLADEIHNIQCVINALCFDTVEFDLSHISGEQVANGDLYAMEDLLEILTDVYHWIKNDRDQGGEIGLNIFSSFRMEYECLCLIYSSCCTCTSRTTGFGSFQSARFVFGRTNCSISRSKTCIWSGYCCTK